MGLTEHTTFLYHIELYKGMMDFLYLKTTV